MFYEISWKSLKQEDVTIRENLEIIWQKVDAGFKSALNPKLILSEEAAAFFEGNDYGAGPSIKDIRDGRFYSYAPRRCERGYYAKFYVCSSLSGFCFMITHDAGCDLYNMIDYEEDLV